MGPHYRGPPPGVGWRWGDGQVSTGRMLQEQTVLWFLAGIVSIRRMEWKEDGTEFSDWDQNRSPWEGKSE